MNRAIASRYMSHITAPLSGAVILIMMILPPVAFAASDLQNILTNTQDIITIVLRIVMTLAFVVFIWGIVKFIAAAGNPQQIKQAKSIILYGIIGIAVMAMITGIITFLQVYFGISGGVPITIPQF